MANDLTRPLGLAKPSPGRRRLYLAAGIVIGFASTAGIAALSSFLFADPGEREAIAIGMIDEHQDSSADATSPAPSATGLIELIPDGALSQISPQAGGLNTAALQLAATPQPELIEDGPYGPLPHVGADGTRAVNAYALPFNTAALSADVTRVAIVITGIGDPASDNRAAVEQLPGAVTFAFSPYGQDLTGLLNDARSRGHEILLQVPLEPYGYPNNDPGPHTLTVDAPATQNIDRLHWLMSRITNYVGVINFLGARFTSDDAALTPALAEIGERGLLYLDDGTSRASRAGVLAGEHVPFLQADIVLDAITETAAIDERLDEAVTIATRQGYAIAIGTAFPVTIDCIAAFAKTAEERGIALVPVTALIDIGKAL